MPTLRVPLSKLTFLSINTSAAYHATHYSRSTDATSALSMSPCFVSTARCDRIPWVGLHGIWDLQSGFARTAEARDRAGVHFDFTSYFLRLQEHATTGVTFRTSSSAANTKITYGLTNRLFYRGRS
jgi:hypothetical protein